MCFQATNFELHDHYCTIRTVWVGHYPTGRGNVDQSFIMLTLVWYELVRVMTQSTTRHLEGELS